MHKTGSFMGMPPPPPDCFSKQSYLIFLFGTIIEFIPKIYLDSQIQRERQKIRSHRFKINTIKELFWSAATNRIKDTYMYILSTSVQMNHPARSSKFPTYKEKNRKKYIQNEQKMIQNIKHYIMIRCKVLISAIARAVIQCVIEKVFITQAL